MTSDFYLSNKSGGCGFESRRELSIDVCVFTAKTDAQNKIAVTQGNSMVLILNFWNSTITHLLRRFLSCKIQATFVLETATSGETP